MNKSMDAETEKRPYSEHYPHQSSGFCPVFFVSACHHLLPPILIGSATNTQHALLSDLILCTAFWFHERLGKRLGAKTPETKEFEKLYRDVLALHPLPSHRKDWRERQKAFDRRIAFALKNRPLSIKQIADVGGKALFELVPMGQIFKDNDKEIFLSTVRLCQMNADDDLRARCDPQQIWNENP